MQPSGPQSGRASPAGRTRLVAAAAFWIGAQFGIHADQPAPSQPAARILSQA